MDYDFETLAKEIAVALREDENAPADAANAARKMVIAAVTSTRERQDPRLTVGGVCRGIMAGMVLLEKDLPAASVALLGQMATVAQEASLDPADCMTWAMEGIAPVAKMAPGGPDAVRAAIEENYMGAGEVFDRIVAESGS
jgi:hypothetical protein